ncbi:hypothetical protein FA15DRAFT_682284 [Coprinopsis marcescibilis]|uniref:Uncharacterized protein n=1 Tax=Coprinopsis marcescibilis TaxID=230819 RepID=A0A5C3KM16_COPMA|nr:hypothetical protein FA15DRAFT_682284 [Coprinopsis marcescibilis]
MSSRKTPVPLLIDAFPAPPSHIPLTPSASHFNPPPSRPPSVPLPPVPGPSRLSDADTLQFLLSSSRSRRSSKYSLAASDNNRDSIISTSSSTHGVVSPPISFRRPSPRTSLASSVANRPSIAFSIDEEDESVSRNAILRDVASPMLPVSDDEPEVSPRRRRRRHQANESISEIDMRDILGAASGEDEEAGMPLSKSAGSEKKQLSTSHSRKSSLAYLKFDNPDDHHFHSRSQSISSAHSIPKPLSLSPSPSILDSYNDLASASTSTLRSSSMANIRAASSPESPAPVTKSPPKSKKTYPNTLSSSTATMPRVPPRSPSPDIDTIIQSTPKPSRSFSSSANGKRSRATSLRSVKSMKNVSPPVDEFGVLPVPLRLSKSTIGKKSSSHSFDPDQSLDYIVSGVWQSHPEEDDDKLRALERELENSGNLHTPLPHLMVRHGLLSSHSKLLSQAESRASTPLYGVDGRPGSTMSVNSIATKSGVIKDERDTPMRRVRHRDGRLLRGGIGLTTGLGWSDSEDEDSPSPLTKRISTLNLARRSSASSFFAAPSSAQRPHPLSRSYSSGTLFGDGIGEYEEDSMKDTSDWALRQGRSPPRSNPPTAWQRKMSGASTSTRTSVASSGGRLSIASSGGRLSVASTGSAFSLEVTSPEDGSMRSSPHRKRRLRESASSGESAFNRRSGDDSLIGTPSTASTLSIPLPVTPQHEHQVPVHIDSAKKQYLDKDKSLPPLPGVLKKPSTKSSTPASKMTFPRARTFSSTSSSNSTPIAVHSTPVNVRPLQLPRQVRAATRGDRPAVPVSSVSSSRPASQVEMVTSPTKPKPRTGTGMITPHMYVDLVTVYVFSLNACHELAKWQGLDSSHRSKAGKASEIYKGQVNYKVSPVRYSVLPPSNNSLGHRTEICCGDLVLISMPGSEHTDAPWSPIQNK